MPVNFGDFNENTSLQGGDFVVGYRGVQEFRTTVNTVTSYEATQFLLKTGSQATGTITTTKNLSTLFTDNDEFITKRYADALAFETTISGNFIPSLYYTKTQTDDLLDDPNSSVTTVRGNSASWGSGGTYGTVFSVNSGRYDSNYTTTQENSAFWGSGGTGFTTNSGRYESNYTTTKDLSSTWGTGGSYGTVFSENSGRYDSVYTTILENSATYTTYNYVYGNYLPLTGGVLTGALTATSFNLTDATLPYQKFNVADGQTLFTLTSAVYTINDILVFVSGIYQRKDTYNLVDSYTLQLTTPPPSGNDVLEVAYLRYFPYTLTVPAPNSVITSSIADRAVTTEKLADGSVTIAKLSAVFAQISVQTLTGNGLTSSFTLLSGVETVNELTVYISGVYQNKSSYNVINSNTIVFTETPATSAVIEINYARALPFYAPPYSYDSVTTSMIEDGAVTSPKLNRLLNIQELSAVSLSANTGLFPDQLKIGAQGTVTGFTGLSAVTVFGAVSARTLTTTDYAILVRINNNNYGIPLFTIT